MMRRAFILLALLLATLAGAGRAPAATNTQNELLNELFAPADTNLNVFAAPVSNAIAVVNQPFSFTLHASRAAGTLVLTVTNAPGAAAGAGLCAGRGPSHEKNCRMFACCAAYAGGPAAGDPARPELSA